MIDFEGMDEQPSWYFTEPSFLFEKLEIPIPEDPANETTATTSTTSTTATATTTTAASSTASLPASSPPTYQKLTPTVTTNNIKK